MRGVYHHKKKKKQHIVIVLFSDIDASLANRLNDRPQIVEEPMNDQQNDYKPILKCPKCGNDMVLRNRKSGDGKYLSCVGFPGCKNAIWFAASIQNIDVLNQNCETVPGNCFCLMLLLCVFVVCCSVDRMLKSWKSHFDKIHLSVNPIQMFYA